MYRCKVKIRTAYTKVIFRNKGSSSCEKYLIIDKLRDKFYLDYIIFKLYLH